MNTSFLRFLLLGALAAFFSCGVLNAAKPSRPVGAKEEVDIFYALKDGDWHSNIWGIAEAYSGKQPADLKIGNKRPGKNDRTNLGRNGITVTVSKPVEVLNYTQRSNKATLVFAKGADFKAESFEGQRGNGSSGTFIVQEGAKLEVRGMRLSGRTLTDDGTGTMNQQGGEVRILTALWLTDGRTASSSPKATGIYNLNAGTLDIGSNATLPALFKGIGKGIFNFNGGTLVVKSLNDSLENKGGTLAPGGVGEPGNILLLPNSKGAPVYKQNKGASLAIDIAGQSKFDKLHWKCEAKNGEVVLEDGAQIEVTLGKGYRPTTGTEFEIIAADKLTVNGTLKMTGPNGRDFLYKVVPDKNTLRLVYDSGRGGGPVSE